MNRVMPLILLLILSLTARGQRTCGTPALQELRYPDAERARIEAAFEDWLAQKKASFYASSGLQETNETTVYQIPVVVHIIHTGEPAGQGYNIPDEQVYAQIEVLNRDFRRLNADTSNTPALFKPLAADIGFEFVLAKRDPAGLPTSGITRTNGNKTDWRMSDNTTLKSLVYWPAEDYLNIWVAPLDNPTLGWAEFPTSDILDGVNEVANNNALTDGVVIHTRAFGSKDFYPQGSYLAKFALGRTATHEIGHFFGLRHISGDGGCSVDDYVDDTPRTSSYYTGCPAPGSFYNSCEAEESMFMNYMEYVDDGCMNLFSLGQKERMVIIINNSPRRASLLTSLALQEPPVLDLAIDGFTAPGSNVCSGTLSPAIRVINTGLTYITSAEISLLLNNAEAERTVFSLSLAPNQDTLLTFSGLTLPGSGEYILAASLIAVNGTTDMLGGNNTATHELFYPETTTGFFEDFGTWPQSWAVRTEAPLSQWGYSRAPYDRVDNTAARLNYYRNFTPFNDQLISPVIDLTAASRPYLLFDYAYGYTEGKNDALAVVLSADCGRNYTDTLFLRAGEELATTRMPVAFTPGGAADWRRAVIDLSAYLGLHIQLAFVGRSDGGNNIYLDNFRLQEGPVDDLAVKAVLNPSGVFVSGTGTPIVVVENLGTAVIDQLTLRVNRADETLTTLPYSGLQLAPGARINLEVPLSPAPGTHLLTFEVLAADDHPDNNTMTLATTWLQDSEPIPFRQRFNTSDWQQSWSTGSPLDSTTWSSWPAGGFIYYGAFDQGNAGLHDWLVLPLLDFSRTAEAGLQFRIAYGNDNNRELLRIWLSDNGGTSFNYLVQEFLPQDMATAIANDNWVPQRPADWRTVFIDLSDYAGSDNLLLAFESIDGDGNDIYLDDIELFVSSQQVLVEVPDNRAAVYPNPVSGFDARITFNLSARQDITVRLLDNSGRELSRQALTNVLNQTYPVEVAVHRNGLYLLEISGPEVHEIIRLVVNR